MRSFIVTLVTVFSMCCLVACGGEKTNDANAGRNNDDPVVTAEATAEPTKEPSSEVEPTEEPSVVYEGIDMNSTLSGQEWLETFIGVIEEPKVVVFNDNTGKKVIVEQEGEVTINPEEDAIALYFPEGYSNGSARSGIALADEVIDGEYYSIYYFDSETMREAKEGKAGFRVMYGDEKMVLIFNWKVE